MSNPTADQEVPVVQQIWTPPYADGRITGITTYRDKVIIATERAVYTMEMGLWYDKFYATKVEPR